MESLLLSPVLVAGDALGDRPRWLIWEDLDVLKATFKDHDDVPLILLLSPTRGECLGARLATGW